MRRKQPPTALRALLISLGALIASAATIGIFAAHSYNGSTFRARGKSQITMDHVMNGTFGAHYGSVNWVPEAGDGVFSQESHGDIILVDLKSGTNRTLVSRQDVKDEHGKPLEWYSWQPSANMDYILFKADWVQNWRWSSFGNYYIHSLEDGTTVPLTPPSSPPKVVYASWSPVGNSIAYVSENDIYIVPEAASPGSPIRVTTGGNSSFFHGVPDWVYEEEVFGGESVLWWSPDARNLAYLALDETKVPVYEYPVYNPSENSDEVHPYPSSASMRYPKPGYENPIATAHIFSLDTYNTEQDDGLYSPSVSAVHATQTLTWDSQLAPEDSILFEVAWVGNETLLIKEVNRAASEGSVVFFDVGASSFKGTGRVVRTLGEKGEEGDSGWIDSAQNVHPLLNSGFVSLVGSSAYLDVLPNKDGFNHIALFSPADSSTPRWLTTGDWEVDGEVLGVDVTRGLVYFVGASSSGLDRHIYSVMLPTVTGPPPSVAPLPKDPPSALTDATRPGFYGASFSPQAGFYLLTYKGPSTPSQSVLSIANSTFEFTLTNNQKLNDTNAMFQAPITSYTTIDSDGYELNVKEMRPPGFDESGRVRYPVLFKVYGGPFSQQVTSQYGRDWHDYLVCTLKYIVVIVDGRGTGFKGRKLRNPVRGTLGTYETIDQINAARIWAKRRYVDPKRIGIWGWSYGGFMSAKVLEANAGIHSLAMSVAPVTSWRMYDSIYTERYMGTPQKNPEGYVNASISSVEGFKNADYLLAHGSGDDNVHFAHTAHLIDMFTQHSIRRYRFRMFTDSNHRIITRNGFRELHEWMTAFLIEKWGKGPVRRS
ncbi:dipeptidyl aminopeptidase [Clavulina sp. PMI_390]|nr:dipeptidyl aminopeptidase [Clavulina sp. PMI_390]